MVAGFLDESSFRSWLESPETCKFFGIKEITVSQEEFPDLILVTSEGKVLSVEVEFRTSNFYHHGHSPEEVDLVIVWIDDLPHVTHRFKVFEANIDTPVKIDEILRSKRNLVLEKVRKLPRLAYPWERSYKSIVKYKRCWRAINDLTKLDVFGVDLDHLKDIIMEEIQCKSISCLEELLARKDERALYAMSLVRVAKALVLRGTLKLHEEGLIPNEKTSYLGLNRKKIRNVKRAIELGRISDQQSSIAPFDGYIERNLDFATDYLDGFTENYNFRAGAMFPCEEVCFILNELTIWGFLGRYKRCPSIAKEGYNPLGREFSPSHVVKTSWQRLGMLKELGFDPPDDYYYLVQQYYQYLVLPISFLTEFGRVPKLEDIRFFHYVPTREDRLKGWRDEESRLVWLNNFYKNYPKLIPYWH